MTTTKIKPCPLCGRDPVIDEMPDALAANGKWIIICDVCDLSLQTYYIADGYPGADKRPMLTLAIRRWNRRKKIVPTEGTP